VKVQLDEVVQLIEAAVLHELGGQLRRIGGPRTDQRDRQADSEQPESRQQLFAFPFAQRQMIGGPDETIC